MRRTKTIALLPVLLLAGLLGPLYEHEIRETVRRDHNRTSIVQRELFNQLHRPIPKQMMRPMATMVRELDPTRLALDESGGWAFGANLYLPGSFEPTRMLREWGADVAVLPHGEGRIVVSQLRLLPHLGEDPVADKLLFNLIRFAGE